MSKTPIKILFSGADAAHCSAVKQLLPHFSCLNFTDMKQRFDHQLIDVDEGDFVLDRTTIETMSAERAIVIILITTSFVSNKVIQGPGMQALADAASAEHGVHLFPVYCAEVDNPESFPWSHLQWLPDSRKPLSTYRSCDLDSQGVVVIESIERIQDRRQFAHAPFKLAVFCADRDTAAIRPKLKPILELIQDGNYFTPWSILPGDVPTELFAKAAGADNLVFFWSAASHADENTYGLATRIKDQAKAIDVVYAPFLGIEILIARRGDTVVIPRFEAGKPQFLTVLQSPADAWAQIHFSIGKMLATDSNHIEGGA